MESLWQNTSELPSFDTLNQDLKTDVLIIGGGIAGLLCAYSLEQYAELCRTIDCDFQRC